MPTTTAPTIPLTKARVIDLTLDLLATYLVEDRQSLRARLQADGPNMPIDSLDLFDVLSEVRQQTGLKLPAKECKRDTLRSLDALADFVMAEVGAP
jgi:acyl carrier protein